MSSEPTECLGWHAYHMVPLPVYHRFYAVVNTHLEAVTTQPDGCRYVSATHNRRMYIRKYPLRLNNRNDQRRRIRPESLRFTPYVLRMCLAKQAKLSTIFLGKMNHAHKLLRAPAPDVLRSRHLRAGLYGQTGHQTVLPARLSFNF
jgi:hypothetical protein